MAITKEMLRQVRSLFAGGIPIPGLGGMGVIKADKISMDFVDKKDHSEITFLKNAQPEISIMITGHVTGAMVFDDKVVINLSGIPMKTSHTIMAE